MVQRRRKYVLIKMNNIFYIFVLELEIRNCHQYWTYLLVHMPKECYCNYFHLMLDLLVVGEPHPKFIARVNTQKFSIYNSMNCDKFDVAYKTFVTKFPQIKERFTSWGKRYSDDERTFLKN